MAARRRVLGETSRQRRDPEATRAALLAAARREFAAKGLAGARVEEIAAIGGVNKQLVYHHFGSKDELYLAVLEEVYAEIREREKELRLGDLPPREAMVQLVSASFDYLAEHPDFIALLNDENRHQAAHVRVSSRLHAMNSPLIALIAETLEKGEREGVFRKGVDSVDLYISIAGLSYFYFSNLRTLSAIFGVDLATPDSVASRRRHVVDFVLNAIRP